MDIVTNINWCASRFGYDEVLTMGMGMLGFVFFPIQICMISMTISVVSIFICEMINISPDWSNLLNSIITSILLSYVTKKLANTNWGWRCGFIFLIRKFSEIMIQNFLYYMLLVCGQEKKNTVCNIINSVKDWTHSQSRLLFLFLIEFIMKIF